MLGRYYVENKEEGIQTIYALNLYKVEGDKIGEPLLDKPLAIWEQEKCPEAFAVDNTGKMVVYSDEGKLNIIKIGKKSKQIVHFNKKIRDIIFLGDSSTCVLLCSSREKKILC